MRSVLPPVFLTILEAGRERRGPYSSSSKDGLQGLFMLFCPCTGRTLLVLATDGRGWSEDGLPGVPWEHVSVSLPHQRDKCPSWPEMAWVKDIFWGPDETVMELHVPAGDHVNYHPGCLHLWRPVGIEIPRPPVICVGPASVTEEREGGSRG